MGLGTNGLSVGLNTSVIYSDGDFSIAAGAGVGTGYSGWNVGAQYKGYGVGYGRTKYDESVVQGQSFKSQAVGTITGYFNHNSFSISNDLFWGDQEDRYRTSAAELTIGKLSIGTYIYTNDGKKESGGIDNGTENESSPIWGNGKYGKWKNGEVYFAPAWIGYRNGNQITRIGYSARWIQDLTQNGIHKTISPTPFFLNYNYFRTGGYFYSGYYNPHSLWDR
jgi:hypothetical protein